MNARRWTLTILWVGLGVAALCLSACSAGRDYFYFTEPKPGYVPCEYPQPLASGGLFEDAPWPPAGE